MQKISKKKLLDRKMQLEKLYSIYSLNDKRLIDCYSDILSIEKIFHTYYFEHKLIDNELSDFDALITLQDYLTKAIAEYPFFSKYFPYLVFYPTAENYLSVDFNHDYNPISNEENLELLKDFFHDKGFLNEKFRYLLNSNNFFWQYFNNNIDVMGETYYLRCTNQILLFLNNSDNILKFTTATHEMGHSISFLYNNHQFIAKRYFLEIESLFLELLACDYIDKIYPQEGFKRKQFLYSVIFNTAKTLMEKQEIISFINTNNINYHLNLSELQLVNPNYTIDYLLDLFYSSYSEDFTYPLAYLYAVKLYHIYIQDKERALDILQKIMMSQNEKVLLNYLNSINLIDLDTKNVKRSLLL